MVYAGGDYAGLVTFLGAGRINGDNDALEQGRCVTPELLDLVEGPKGARRIRQEFAEQFLPTEAGSLIFPCYL
jgi:hypothetical protein